MLNRNGGAFWSSGTAASASQNVTPASFTRTDPTSGVLDMLTATSDNHDNPIDESTST
jgi:hypothetical protein